MPELDPIKMMDITLVGGVDETRTAARPEEIALFEHPSTGNTYKAVKVGEYPIAFDLVKRLNVAKEKYERLNRCVDDAQARLNDTFCHCVKTSVLKKTGKLECCQSSNSACHEFGLSKVSEDLCSPVDLRKRRDEAKEEMERRVGFIDDMRWFYKTYANIP